VVANPGFESPSVGAGNWSLGVGDGWSWQGYSGVYGQNTQNFLNAPEGLQAAAILNDPQLLRPSAAYQQISGFQAGVSYVVSFYAANPPPNAPNVAVGVLLDGNPAFLDGQIIGRAVTSSSWSRFKTATFTPGPGTHTITFTTGFGTVLIDYVQVIPVFNPPVQQPALLVGRDSQGMKTWSYSPATKQWSQTSAPFPAFTPTQQTAYVQLDTSLRGFGANGNIRSAYNDTTAPFSTWQAAMYTPPPLDYRPPVPQRPHTNLPLPTTNPPSQTDWDAVTWQIYWEITWVLAVNNWYGNNGISGLINEIYMGQDMDVQTVGDYLAISGGSGDATFLSILSLVANGA